MNKNVIHIQTYPPHFPYVINLLNGLNNYADDLENFDILNKIMEKRFSEPFPARATVEVARLPKDVMIEMDAIVSITQ